MSTEKPISYEEIEKMGQFLLQRTALRPKIGVICGTGLASLAENLTNSQTFDYGDIPNFPVSTVFGHPGRLIFGVLNGKEVICMQGRFHYLEGYPLWKCAMPVRLMKIIGITHLIVTNAAGSINSNFKVGDIMIMKDHLNLMGFGGQNPLIGFNDERFGPRFPSMTRAYDPQLRETAKSIAKTLNIEDIIQEGVYAYLGGPSFETVAELKMLERNGADAVGMSTVPEVITAVHCGIKIFGASLITNKCIMDYDTNDEVKHEEVVDVAGKQGPILRTFISNIIKAI